MECFRSTWTLRNKHLVIFIFLINHRIDVQVCMLCECTCNRWDTEYGHLLERTIFQHHQSIWTLTLSPVIAQAIAVKYLACQLLCTTKCTQEMNCWIASSMKGLIPESVGVFPLTLIAVGLDPETVVTICACLKPTNSITRISWSLGPPESRTLNCFRVGAYPDLLSALVFLFCKAKQMKCLIFSRPLS